MSPAVHCDRCRAFLALAEPGSIAVIPATEVNYRPTAEWMHIPGDVVKGPDSGIDLCPQCRAAFEVFMRGGKVIS